MKQLKTNWGVEEVGKQVAKTTLRVPFLALVEAKSKASKEAQKQAEEKAAEKKEDKLVATNQTEV